MSRRDAIRTVGDLITELDVARGAASEPAVRIRLDDARTLLNHRVIQLVHEQLDDSSEQFKEALANLEACKSKIAGGKLVDMTNSGENLDELLRNTRLLVSLPGDSPTDDPGPKQKPSNLFGGHKTERA